MDVTQIGRSATVQAPLSVKHLAGQRPGQQLQALIVGHPRAGVVTLNINATLIDARTALKFTPGQAVKFQVTKAGEVTELRLVTPAPRTPAVLAVALRHVLPQLTEQSALFQSLTRFTAAGLGNEAKQAQALSRHILHQAPTPRTVTDATQLRAAMLNSGGFLEARMKSADPGGRALTGDLKANLLALRELVGPLRNARAGVSPAPAQAATPRTLPSSTFSPSPSPSLPDSSPAPGRMRGNPSASHDAPITRNVVEQLGKQVEGSVAKIVHAQLRSAAALETFNPVVHVSLPIHNAQRTDILELRIERDARQSDDSTPPSWRVHLKIELRDHGPVEAQLAFGGDSLSAVLWAERERTGRAITAGLDSLSGALDAAGVKLKSLHCVSGPVSPWPAHLGCDNLLEVHA